MEVENNRKALKSVHITNYYHKNSGGIAAAYNKLLEAANRHQRFVRFIVPGEAEEIEEVGEFGRIYYVPAKFSPVFDKRYRLMLPWKTYLFGKTPIRRILAEEQPDIIEIGEKYALSLLAGLIQKGMLKSLNRPMLVHFSCERMDDNLRAFVGNITLLRWFSRRVMGNYVFPMFDFHLANSEYTAQELKDAVSVSENQKLSKAFFNFCWRYFHSPRVPVSKRIFVNQCGADTNIFTPERKNANIRQAILDEAGFPPDATLLFYAGRISPEKNIALLLNVFQHLVKFSNYDTKHNFHLLIAGSGPQTDWLKSELERKTPGRYKFFGHLTNREKLADLYANADIFIHPNPREPFGITPLEAMASGTPVLAPNSGGILSYATDENAWLKEPDTQDFFAGVYDIFRDEAGRRAKIANALETARRYTWENSTDNLFTLYDEMYREFQVNRELYSYKINPKKIDFVKEVCIR